MKNKKLYIYLIVVLVVLLIISSIIYFAFFKQGITPKDVLENVSKKFINKKAIIKQQLEELNILREQINSQPFTQEETNSQLEKLNVLHQEAISQ